MLNNHPVLREHDCGITCKLCFWGTCFCPFFFLAAVAIYIIISLITKTDTPPTKQANDMRVIGFLGLSIIVIPFYLLLCMYGKRRTRKVFTSFVYCCLSVCIILRLSTKLLKPISYIVLVHGRLIETNMTIFLDLKIV